MALIKTGRQAVNANQLQRKEQFCSTLHKRAGLVHFQLLFKLFNSFVTSLSYEANAGPPTSFLLEREGKRKNRIIRQAGL
jgi:hypothetical protein